MLAFVPFFQNSLSNCLNSSKDIDWPCLYWWYYEFAWTCFMWVHTSRTWFISPLYLGKYISLVHSLAPYYVTFIVLCTWLCRFEILHQHINISVLCHWWTVVWLYTTVQWSLKLYCCLHYFGMIECECEIYVSYLKE